MFTYREDLKSQQNQFFDILDNKYTILETLGQGRFAKVKKAIDIQTRKIYAVKIMRRNAVDSNKKIRQFIKEILILKNLKHENLVKIKKVKLNADYKKNNGQTKQVSYYVMSIASYGELFKFLKLSPKFDEGLARYYFKQLINVIFYLHQNHICHLDIKPENLVINKKFNLQLIDFGFSLKSDEEQYNKQFIQKNKQIGTLNYSCPEQLQNQGFYGQDQDLFSCGCVLFQMVMNCMPFQTAEISDPYYQRLQNNPNKYWSIYQNICKPSESFKNLIYCMLNKDQSKRLNILQILDHPWLQEPIPQINFIQNEMFERFQYINGTQESEFQQNKEIKLQNFFIQSQILFDNQSKQQVKIKDKYYDKIQYINEEIKKKQFQQIKQRNSFSNQNINQNFQINNNESKSDSDLDD